jgi:hypothetical protein
LFDIIETIEVSTDFDYREMRCNNYAGLFDEHDQLTLVINFKKLSTKNFTLYTQWFDPDDKMVEEQFWDLKAGYYEHGQFVFQSFNNGKSMKHGIWSLKLSFNSHFDKRTKYNYYNYIPNNDILINYKFNVLPNIKSSNINLNELFNFWSFDSICVEEDVNESSKSIKICSQNSTWSSLYPDPKSDIYNHMF